MFHDKMPMTAMCVINDKIRYKFNNLSKNENVRKMSQQEQEEKHAQQL